MTLTPPWRTRLFALAGSALGIVLGASIASESYFWPSVIVGGLAGVILLYIQAQPVAVLLLGGALFGYIVGNRGFAQLSLTGNFPLLPAEFVLLVGGMMLGVDGARHREVPIRRDPLNLALVLWLVVGTARLCFGLREHGFAAIRDYALVYYSAFFFLAQHFARAPGASRFLRGCVLAGSGVLAVLYPLFIQFPDFFAFAITFRGLPLIYLKGDLAGNFLTLAALLAYAVFERTRHARWLLLSLAFAGVMMTTGSRSSIVGLAVGAACFVVAGRWRLIGALAGGAVAAAVVILAVAEARHISWRQTPLHSLYERVVSIADPFGQRTYQYDDALNGDNNIFRMVWWRAAIDETVETNPWFGLGFGHDLASRFVREYYPEGGEEFTARSPHNVFITVFARMGLMGLAIFLGVATAILLRTWRALRDPARAFTSGAYWSGALSLLVCACFGVVLEGPMGAIVFWSVLGLANAMEAAATDAEPAEPAALPTTEAPALQQA